MDIYMIHNHSFIDQRHTAVQSLQLDSFENLIAAIQSVKLIANADSVANKTVNK